MKTYYIKTESVIEWMFERGCDQEQAKMKMDLAESVVKCLKEGKPYVADFQSLLDYNLSIFPCEYVEGNQFKYDCELGELEDDELDWENSEFKILYPKESEVVL